MLIGATVRPGTFAASSAADGPWRATRVYYGPSNPLPSAWDPSLLPDLGVGSDVQVWLSYSNHEPSRTTLRRFLASAPDDVLRRLVLVPEHEPELNALSNGLSAAGVLAKAETARSVIDALPTSRPRPQLAHLSSAAAHQVGGPGHSGAWVPPAGLYDLAGLDTYQTSIDQLRPLTEDPRVARWMELYRPGDSAAPAWHWAIGEYNRGLPSSAATSAEAAALDARRLEVLAADVAYLRSRPSCRTWMLWASRNPTSDKDWTTLPASYTRAWHQLALANAAS